MGMRRSFSLGTPSRVAAISSWAVPVVTMAARSLWSRSARIGMAFLGVVSM
jgi:hypothetical protein